MRLVHVLFGATLEIQVKSLEATCISWWFPSLPSSKRTSPQIADPKEVREVDSNIRQPSCPPGIRIGGICWFDFCLLSMLSPNSATNLWKPYGGEVFRKAWGNLGRWGNIRERGDWWKVHNMFSSLVGEDYRKISSHLHQTIHQTKHFLKNVLWIYRWPVCSCEVSEASKEVMDFEKFCDWANIVLVVHIKFLFFLLFSYSVYSFLSSMVSAFKFFENPRVEENINRGGACTMGVGIDITDFKHLLEMHLILQNFPDSSSQDPTVLWRSQVNCWRQITWTSSDSERALPLSCTIDFTHLAQKQCLDGVFMFFCFVSALWVFENHSHCIICQAF